MKDELETRDPKHPVFADVGAVILEDREKVKLPYCMGSMDKVKAEPEVMKRFSAKYQAPYDVTDKLDGISGLLYWKDGKLSSGVERGHESCVHALLTDNRVSSRARVNQADSKFGLTPLAHAAACGHDTCVCALLEAGDVNVNQVDEDGRTPLAWAAGNGHESCVCALLAHEDVTVNQVDNDGMTPLAYAADNGHNSCVRALMADNRAWT